MIANSIALDLCILSLELVIFSPECCLVAPFCIYSRWITVQKSHLPPSTRSTPNSIMWRIRYIMYIWYGWDFRSPSSRNCSNAAKLVSHVSFAELTNPNEQYCDWMGPKYLENGRLHPQMIDSSLWPNGNTNEVITSYYPGFQMDSMSVGLTQFDINRRTCYPFPTCYTISVI